MSEFSLIDRLVAQSPSLRADVLLGPGDDAALLQPPVGQVLAMTTDTLIAGRHFPESADAQSVGWKSMAVNLSDLAAMAAQPAWVTIALATPRDTRESWLSDFMQGVAQALTRYDVSLVGGDLTQGPLSINVCATGFVPPGQALRRSGARVGDLVCVTGHIGDAALALELLQAGLAGSSPELQDRLDRPTPRVAAGLAMRNLASAAVDVSDGLAADLAHVLAGSGVGAAVQAGSVPMSAAFANHCPAQQRLSLQMAGGDDYELCLCVSPGNFDELAARMNCSLTVIGEIEQTPGLRIFDANASEVSLPRAGFDHFD